MSTSTYFIKLKALPPKPSEDASKPFTYNITYIINFFLNSSGAGLATFVVPHTQVLEPDSVPLHTIK